MAERRHLAFETVATTQWLISPVPRLRVPQRVRRVLSLRETSERVRSVEATHRPQLDTTDWVERDLVAGFRLRAPAGLPYVATHGPPTTREAPDEVLVALWQDADCSFAFWLGGSSGFPTAVFPLRDRPRREEWSESTLALPGRAVHVGTARVSVRGSAPIYQVSAFWACGADRWLRALGTAGSRDGQELLLAMLLSLRADAA